MMNSKYKKNNNKKKLGNPNSILLNKYFKSLISSEGKFKLNISTWNINGKLNKKLEFLNHVLIENKINIIYLTESRVPVYKERPIREFFSNMYIITSPAINSYSKWGNMFLIDPIFSHVIEKIKIWNDNRTISFDLNLLKLGSFKNNFNKLTIIGIYAPSSNISEKHEYFQSILNFIQKLSNPYIIIGDFNFHMYSKMNLDQVSCKPLKNILNYHGFLCGESNNESFTFFKEKKGYKTCIDHTIASYDLTKYINNHAIAPICPGLAKDHRRIDTSITLPITAEINTNSESGIKEKIIWPNKNHENINTFQEKLKEIKIDTNQSIENINIDITNKINKASRQSFIYKEIKERKWKKTIVNQEINNLQTNYNRLLNARLTFPKIKLNIPIPKKIHKVNLNDTEWRVKVPTIISSKKKLNKIKTNIKLKLKEIRNKYHFKIDELFQIKLKKVIEFCQNSPNKSPKIFFTKMNPNKNKQKFNQSILRINNKITNNDKQIKDHLHTVYQNIFSAKTVLNNQLESPWWNTQHIKNTKEIIQQDSSINKQITLSELQSIIEQAGKNKSSPDMIQYEHLKLMDQDSLIEIVELYNKVLLKGEIPSMWKKNVTLPIYKSGDPLSSNNYRPITLAPVLYKVFINILNNRISKLLESSEIIFPFQNGFRKERSVYNNIYYLLEIINQAKSAKVPLAVAYLDIQKCYDSIEHWVIKETFENYGFSKNIVSLIENIYEGNSTQISTPYGLTEEIQITRGVKQGCPMSPLIYILISNPLLWWIHETSNGIEIPSNVQSKNNKITSLAFADDLTFLTTSIAELQNMFNKVEVFNQRNGLMLSIETDIKNPSKTVFSTNIPGIHNIKLHQQNTEFNIPLISTDTSYKYLGIWINLDMNWNKQMNQIQATVSKFINHLNYRCYSTKHIVSIINKVLSPSITYRSAIISFPYEFLNNINWRIGNLLYRKLHLPGWNSPSHIQSSEELGGFGVVDMVAIAYAQQTRVLNQLMNSADDYIKPVINRCLKINNSYADKIFNTALTQTEAEIVENIAISNSSITQNILQKLVQPITNSQEEFDIENYKHIIPNQKPINNSNDTFIQEVWIDGSKTDKDISIAVFYNPSNVNNTTFRINNAPYKSSYLAELLALLYTLRSNPINKNLCIYSDSKSIITAIDNKKSKSKSIHADVLEEVKYYLYKRETQKSITKLLHVYSHLPKYPKKNKEKIKYKQMLQTYGSKWENIRLGNQEADKLTQENKITVSWPWTFGPKHKKWAIKRNDDIASSNKSKFSKDSYKHAWKKHNNSKIYPNPQSFIQKFMNNPTFSINKKQEFLFKLKSNKLMTNNRIKMKTLESWLKRQKPTYQDKHQSENCALGCNIPETVDHFLTCKRNKITPTDLTKSIRKNLNVMIPQSDHIVIDILKNTLDEETFKLIKSRNKKLKTTNLLTKVLELTIEYAINRWYFRCKTVANN